MAAEKGRDVFCCREPPQEFPHVALGRQIQPPRGFVEEKNFWAAHERPCDLDSSFHPRAVRADQLPAKFGVQADVVQKTLYFLVGIWQVADARKVIEVFSS